MRRANQHLTDQELLTELDEELPMGQRASAQAHLGHCLDCQARRGRMARAAGDYSALYRSGLAEPAAVQDQARERLRGELEEIGRTPPGWFGAFGFGSLTMPRWALRRGAHGDGVADSGDGTVAAAAGLFGASWWLTTARCRPRR